MMNRTYPSAAAVGAIALAALAVIQGCGGGEKPSAETRRTPTAAAPARASRVLLEIDQMQGTPALQDTLAGGPAEASLKKIYADAGIELDIRHDQTDLPRVDRVRLADLHNLMTSFETIPAPPGVGKIHALIVTADEEDPRTLGIMFDFNDRDLNSLPREGFAVFASPHEGLPNPTAELLLTTAHEMAHCFNLHHADWDGQGFHDHATVESYSMADTVRWALSEGSARHIKVHQVNEVWPGQGGLPFGTIGTGHLDSHKSDPAESFSVLSDPTARGVSASPEKGLARERVALRAVDTDDLRLVLEAPKTTYLVGEPVVLNVGLHNTGSRDRYVLPLLDPRFQFLNVEIRKKPAPEFRAFRSAVLADARGIEAARLKPGENRHEEIKVFFGADGWTFKEPGTYEVRADYPAGALTADALGRETGRVQSPVLELVIQSPPPQSSNARAARTVLRYQEGMFLFLDGASHLRGAKANLERVVEQERGAAVAPALRLALAQAELNPAPQPGSRVATGADVAKAKEYLDGLPAETLPTSSVARTTRELAVEVQKRGEPGDATDAQRMRATAREIERQETVRDRTRMRRVTTRGGP